jgi:hypothetical protein
MTLNEMSMLRFRTYCNKRLIASHATAKLAGDFTTERQKKYPRNSYIVSDVNVDGPEGPFAAERGEQSRRYEYRFRREDREERMEA